MEKKNILDVDGIVPNMVLDRTVFGNFVTRLALLLFMEQAGSKWRRPCNPKYPDPSMNLLITSSNTCNPSRPWE